MESKIDEIIKQAMNDEIKFNELKENFTFAQYVDMNIKSNNFDRIYNILASIKFFTNKNPKIIEIEKEYWRYEIQFS